MPGRVDAVLFDAGGVLMLPDATVLGPLLAPYGAATGYSEHHRAHYAAMRAQDELAPPPARRRVDGDGLDDWSVYDRAYVRALGGPDDDPRIFDFALAVLDLAPERVAYVGDSVRNDVRGAEAARLVALHLDPYDDHPDARHERIHALGDLLAWVGVPT